MSPPRRLRLGARGSALARRQAELVVQLLAAAAPQVEVEVQVLRTEGDEPHRIHQDGERDSLPPPGQGIFVRTIEAALTEGRIDLAVHSFKDLPTVMAPGLRVAAFPPREDPRDVLVARGHQPLAQLPAGARVGTGSPRRRALLLAARPDLVVEPIRGNVDTRLRLVAEGRLDAVVLAAAGLKRLGRQAEIADWLDPSVFVPAIGQGMLAVQVRAGDSAVETLVARLDDPVTRTCATAERAVAATLQASCSTPVAAYAWLEGEQLRLKALALLSGQGALVQASVAGPAADAERLGAQAAAELLAAGAGRTQA